MTKIAFYLGGWELHLSLRDNNNNRDNVEVMESFL